MKSCSYPDFSMRVGSIDTLHAIIIVINAAYMIYLMLSFLLGLVVVLLILGLQIYTSYVINLLLVLM